MKKSSFIPIAEPVFDNNEKKNLIEAIESGWVSSMGYFVKTFEKNFSKYCNTRYSLAVHSGTAALHLALLSSGIKENDEVIIPNLTYIATANAVTYTGAKPVLVDVCYDTGNLDPAKIEMKITKKTKAIIAVHLFGNPCNMHQINKIARKNNLVVIEDAAEAHGSTYFGKKTGSLSDIACFSFYGNKTITTGEGGMLTSNRKATINRAFFLSNQGRSEKNHYYHTQIGYNYRMTNLQAAVGVAQLKKINKFISKKRYINKFYRNQLKGINKISFLKEDKRCKSNYWMSTILIKNVTQKKRGRFFRHMLNNNIQCLPFFTPINKQPPYRQKSELLDISGTLHKDGVILPSSIKLTNNELKKISQTITKFFSYA